MNSIVSKLKVGIDCPLPCVLDKLVCMAERNETCKRDWKAPRLFENEARFLGNLREILTKKAFQMIREQYDLASGLECATYRKEYRVSVRGSKATLRKVVELGDGVLSCNCNLHTTPFHKILNMQN